MSIATEIQRLQSIKSEIMAALERKSVDTTGKNMSDVGDLIRSIQSEDDSIPLYGTLAHQFNFTLDNPTPYVDTIGGIGCFNRYITPPNAINEDGVEVGYRYGLCTKVEIKPYDYIECIFKLGSPTTTDDHIRALNMSSYEQIDDLKAFLIYRGGYKYWTSYFYGWHTPISNDFNFFNGKKLGFFLKPNGLMDVYVDNVMHTKDFNSGWYDNQLNYALGVTIENSTSVVSIRCSRVRVFRNCHY